MIYLWNIVEGIVSFRKTLILKIKPALILHQSDACPTTPFRFCTFNGHYLVGRFVI